MLGLIALVVLAVLQFVFDVNVPWWAYLLAAVGFFFSGSRRDMK